jgi:hypothetical protein
VITYLTSFEVRRADVEEAGQQHATLTYLRT